MHKPPHSALCNTLPAARGFARHESFRSITARPRVPSHTMLRRSSSLLRRACSQAIAGGSTPMGAWPSACEHVCASSQLSGSAASASDGWPTFGSVAASTRSRAYSSATELASGDYSFAHAASSAGSDAPDVDEPGVLDADAVSSAAALAESDALLQATEAAWYPTIGVQKLVELLHERSELPWCGCTVQRRSSGGDCTCSSMHRCVVRQSRALTP